MVDSVVVVMEHAMQFLQTERQIAITGTHGFGKYAHKT